MYMFQESVPNNCLLSLTFTLKPGDVKISMKNILPFFLLLLATGLPAQNFFQPVAENQIALRSGASRKWSPTRYHTFRLDVNGLSAVLHQAPAEFTPEARASRTIVALPQADGSFEDFAVWKVGALEPRVYQLHPEIRTFAGRSIQNPGKTIRGSVTIRGLRLMVLQPDMGVVYLEPFAEGQTEFYQVYDRVDIPLELRDKKGILAAPITGKDAPAPSNEQLYVPEAEDRGAVILPVGLKIYRFIASCTGEFAQDHGGTKAGALAAVVEYTNFISAIYERDMAIRLQLQAGTEEVLFTDPDTDPYTGTTVPEWLSKNSLVVNTAIGSNNYDIGHLFARHIAGGILGQGFLGAVCSDGNKATGCTTPGFANIYNDNFFGILGQELGHQLSGGHSWNRCGGGDGRSGVTAYEPGSGSTIMSYAGLCGNDDVQNSFDLYFHSGSISEIRQYTDFVATCGTTLPTDNNPPVVTLPYTNNFFIPIKTPFELDGSATDPDGDVLNYCWEEMDLGPEVPLQTPQGNSPLFRTRPPGTATNRYFPRLNTVLNNQSDETEQLPTYSRDLSFRLTARDNQPGGGGVGYAEVEFRATDLAGPFRVMQPNTSAVIWKVGELINVSWDVANSDKAPVNCQKVNIRLSTDGGLTWPITLASGVNNDGAQIIKVPDAVSTKARVRVDAADNVFFDVSNANFKIQQPTQPALTAGLSTDAASVCLPNVFSTQLLTGSLLGFSNPVTVDLIDNDLPAGANAQLSTNTLNPGESSTLTVDLSKVNENGAFILVVRAYAAATDTFKLPLTLTLVRNDFSSLALAQPADGSTGMFQTQVLRWTKAADALTYDLQVAKSPSFEQSTLVATKTTTALDTFKIPFLLEKKQAYYWRVRPNNVCSPHPWTEPYFFSTLAENCSVFTANDLPKNISTNGTPTLESVITVNGGGPISDLNVKQIKGAHDEFKQLEATLTSPSGKTIPLFKAKCGVISVPFNFGLDDSAPNNFLCPPSNFGTPYRPDSPLSAFIGEISTGAWTLRVKDTNTGAGGELTGFQLDFCAAVSLQPPYLVNNNVLSIDPNANKAITPDLLLTEDANNSHDQLTYTLVTLPKKGQLQKSPGAALNVGDQFTQADLDAGAIRYFDAGAGAGDDAFRFTVADGEGGFLGTPKFTIQSTAVGVGEPGTAALRFTLLPNPASDAVWLAFEQALPSEVRVQVLNLSGQLLQAAKLPAGADQLLLHTASWPRGMYLVRVQGADGSGARKLVLR